MARTIFDVVTAENISAYWENMTQNRAPYVGEQLFPSVKKLGLNLDWLNGNSGVPVVLNLSAFDAQAIPRARQGVSVTRAQMPYFKESLYIDEELRQQLNIAIEGGSDAYVNTIMQKIFNDNVQLIESARVQRERMRMALLTTGAISMTANGQSVSYDYGVPSGHKKTAAASWKNSGTDIIADIYAWQQTILEDTGVKPTRAICNSTVWNALRNNTNIRNTIFVYSNGVSTISDAATRIYLL